ncbi:DUF1775 domain-containing protein [Aeromicrobium sp. Leaf350]|uniref:DUF1775 domain-containing protein n=1 Tax=Aeromicrobium sp. Leaf350 TaxID=2876565 RepID=UPI001E3EE127|nr:DUF1775 domain-containing protein [Aeromicrobium sp. Leaf350]
MRSVLARGSVLAVVLGILLGWTAGPASAHVLLERAVPLGDGSVELAITFDHSCDASPTVELAVEVPDGSELVSGTGPAGWSATAEGSRIVFTGPGIGNGENPRFSVVARLTGSVGETLLFPTRQTCADGGGYDWADATESEERPAPRLIATEAVLAEVTQTAPAAAPASDLPDEGASLTQVAVGIAAAALIAFAASHLALRRSAPGPGARSGRGR